MRRHLRVPALLLTTMLAGLLLAGCSGSSGDASGSWSGSVAGDAADAAAEDLATAPGDEQVSVAETDREVVTTATASITVADAAAAAQRVSELAEDVDGRVDRRTEQDPDGGPGSAHLVLRVPADEVTGLLDALAELGEVHTVSVSRDDVTATAVDLDARISALRASTTRLEALMAGAETTEALLAAESALADRQAELESLQSQRTALADRVELSTVDVDLAETYSAPPLDEPDGFLGGLSTGWAALVSTVGATLVVLGVLLPWLVVAALVLGGVLLVRRRARRAVTPDPAPTTDPEPAGTGSAY